MKRKSAQKKNKWITKLVPIWLPRWWAHFDDKWHRWLSSQWSTNPQREASISSLIWFDCEAFPSFTFSNFWWGTECRGPYLGWPFSCRSSGSSGRGGPISCSYSALAQCCPCRRTWGSPRVETTDFGFLFGWLSWSTSARRFWIATRWAHFDDTRHR